VEVANLTAVIDANTGGFTRAMRKVDADLATTGRAMDHYLDGNGRMRDANGRFVASAGGMDGALSRNRRGLLGFGGAGRMAAVGVLGVGAAAGVAAAGIGIGLGIAVRTGIGELKDYQTNVAATNAGLKSTGGVAKVTLKDIEALSGAIERKTGIDGDQIHAAQNMLLTFTKVRKEAGKNNDVFGRATKAAADLSIRGFGSIDSSAKMLGKALNDPIKGISALSRAGVTFTAGQKESIKAMVESGNILGAQKAIMKEVETQVGGSAEAYGKTLPGAVDRLKRGFEAISLSITQTLAPALTAIIDWALANMPAFQEAVNGALTAVQPYLRAFSSLITSVFDGSSESGAKVSKAFNDIKTAIASTAPAFTAIGQAAQKLAPVLGQYLGAAISAIGKIAAAVMPVVASAFEELAPPIARLSAVMLKFSALMLNVLGTVIPPIVRALAPIFKVAFQAIGEIINAIAALLEGDFSGAFRSAVAAVKAIFITLPLMIQTQMLKAVGIAASAAADLGGKIISGIAGAIASGAGRIGSAISTAIKDAITNIDIPGFSPPEHAAAEAIGNPLARGVMLGFLAGTASLPEKIEGRLKAALERGKAAIERQQGAMQTAFGRLGAGVMRAFDAETQRGSNAIRATGAAMTPAEAELAATQAAHEQMAREQDKADAIAALNKAKAEGDAQAILEAQKRYDALLYDEKIAGLQARANAERVARDADTAAKVLNYEAEREVERQRQEDELARLGVFLDKRNATFAQKQKALNAFLNGKSIKDAMAASGTNLGTAFADALNATKGKVTAAVKTLGKLVQDYLRLRSPAKRGALSTLDTWWTAMPKTLLSGVDTSMIGQVAAGIAAPDNAGGTATGGAGTMIVNVTVQGTVTSERELVDTIRAELLRTGQRNGSIFGGYA
jgi:hypothetical protein